MNIKYLKLSLVTFLFGMNCQATVQMDLDGVIGANLARGEKRVFTSDIPNLANWINQNLEDSDTLDEEVDNPAKRLLDESKMTDFRNPFELWDVNKLYMGRALEGSWREFYHLCEKIRNRQFYSYSR